MSDGERPGFVWADTGSIRLMVHGVKAPTDAEWERFLSSTIRERDGEWVASERRGAVIYSRGGMATPNQRRQLKKIKLDPERMPSLVLMSNSRFARGVATAIGWLIPTLKNFHAFRLDQVDEAARVLTPVPAERDEFKDVLKGLLRELDGDAEQSLVQTA